MEPTPAEIQELRDQFQKKLDADGSTIPGGIHPADLARIQGGDDWLRRFLLHNDNDIKETLNMMWETVKWRKAFGTNDINEQNVKLEYLEDGSMFSHSRDIDGKSLFILKCKKHIKGQRDMDELKRCLVYWFERLERQDKGDMITLFFDMADTGLSNMDMDYTKYLISLFKLYYPFFLNYILIFEMPWILNAAFKVIKSWLPEKAVKKINFVSKSNLKNFVDPKNALSCWGGEDSYEFSFTPEDRSGKVERKVHFADSQGDSSPTAETAHAGQGLKVRISPTDHIVFDNCVDSEFRASLSLTNSDDKIISYKIKTTSPEKYRVRPCLGVLKPGASVSVLVAVHAGFQLSALSRDKFLIMGMAVDSAEMSNQELTDLWKQRGSSATEINRLRCSTGGSPAEVSSRNGSILGNASAPPEKLSLMCDNVNKLLKANALMETEIRQTRKYQQILTFSVCLCAIGISYLVWILRDYIAEEKSCPVSQLSDA
ncbi:Motile sperm domain-containing protein 2 [Frankliniella fusca]|uniref:Motile sperm domain-containing protein 2 n=1 Tax=Frankliniella fusca TaxID=407009 RepID=A0AAE1LDY9_9NEOP|nr:Motile sperm domain-containing protein 2 [Frankliniella fusca]